MDSIGIQRIAEERAKQIAKGRTAESDNQNGYLGSFYDMIEAYLVYAKQRQIFDHDKAYDVAFEFWPFPFRDFEPESEDDALASAGALIAALIDAREVSDG